MDNLSIIFIHAHISFTHKIFFPFSCIFPNNSLSLPLNSLNAWLFPNTPHETSHIHIKRRFLNALVLTCWNLANSNYLSKTKQRERPLGVVSAHIILMCCLYTSAWGFQRCSVRQIGRCESLNTWTGHRTGSTFFVCMLLT